MTVNKLEEIIRSYIEIKNEEVLSGYVSQVKDCLEYMNLLTIFSLESNNNKDGIDVAILKGLLKIQDDDKKKLQLALLWGNINNALNEILTDDKIWKTNELNDAIMYALKTNQVSFVKRMLECGCSCKKFLTIENLKELYTNIENTSLLKEILINQKNRHLICNIIKPNYLMNQNDNAISIDSNMKTKAKYMIEKIVHSQVLAMSTNQTSFAYDNFESIRCPHHALFIWCLLQNRLDMAMLFWERGREGIASALLAVNILTFILRYKKKLSRYSSTMFSNTQEICSIQDNIMTFESTALNVLTQCHNSMSKDDVHKLLTREMSNFDNVSILEFVEENPVENETFFSHAAFQDTVNKTWKGGIPNWISKKLIIFSFIIYPIYHLLKTHDLLKKNRTAPEDQENTSFIGNMCQFYNAPLVKFLGKFVSHVVFVLCYSTVLLTNDINMIYSNCLQSFWVFTLLVDEICQISSKRGSFSNKLSLYVKDPWNILDMSMILTYIIGFPIRIIPTSYVHCPTFAKGFGNILAAISLLLFWVRLLQMLSLTTLGPKLIMIQEMLGSLLYFITIVIIVLIAYGVASHTLLKPQTEDSYELMKHVIMKPYYILYGDLSTDDFDEFRPCSFGIEGNNSSSLSYNISSTENISTCAYNISARIMHMIYLLFANLLILNLLIAMFSSAYDKVNENSTNIWWRQFYFLCIEYKRSAFLPPPFIIILWIYQLTRNCRQHCRCGHCSNSNINPSLSNVKIKLDPIEECDLIDKEAYRMVKFNKNKMTSVKHDITDNIPVSHSNVVEQACKLGMSRHSLNAAVHVLLSECKQ